MAFNTFLNLSFRAPGVQKKMDAIGKSFQKFKTGVNNVGQGIRDLGGAVQGAALATAPVAIFSANAVKEAAKYEKGLSAVQAVLLATKDDMREVEKETKRLGITTKFTAVEATEGAKRLAQAGFTTNETVAALAGTLDLAASAEVGVAQAANIVASNIRAFGMEAGEADKAADILALTTATTNTDLIELGEGLKMVAATAKLAGFDLGDTSSALGTLANAGVKGTLGATALRAGLQKLSKPSKKAIALFGDDKGFAAAVQKADGSLRPFEDIMANLQNRILKLRGQDRLKAIGDAAELLGIRGTTAFGAFTNQMQKQVKVTQKDLAIFQEGFKKSGGELAKFNIKVGDSIPLLVAQKLRIKAAQGTAAEMAAIRLDNLAGDFTKLESAVNGFNIELGSLAAPFLRDVIQSITPEIIKLTNAFKFAEDGFTDLFDLSPMEQMNKNLGNVTTEVLQTKKAFEEPFQMDFGQIGGANATPMEQIAEMNKRSDMRKQTTPFLLQLVQGLREGISEAIETVKSGMKEVMSFFGGEGGMDPKEVGKMIGKFLVFATLAAPILAGVAAAFMVLAPIILGVGGAIKIVTGIFQMLSAVAGVIGPLLGFLFTPLGAAIFGIIALGALIFIFWDEIVEAATWAFDFMEGLFNDFLETEFFADLKEMFFEVLAVWTEVWNIISGIFTSVLSALGIDMETTGSAINAIWEGIKFVAVAVWEGIKLQAMFLWTALKVGFTFFWKVFKVVFISIAKIALFVINFWKNLFTGAIDLVVGAFDVFSKEKEKGGLLKGLLAAAKFVALGMWKGLKNVGNRILNLFGELWDTIKKEAIAAATSIGSAISDFFTETLNPFADAEEEAKKLAKTLATARTQGKIKIDVDDAQIGDAFGGAQGAVENKQRIDQEQSPIVVQLPEKQNELPKTLTAKLMMNEREFASAVGQITADNNERDGLNELPGHRRNLVQKGIGGASGN